MIIIRKSFIFLRSLFFFIDFNFCICCFKLIYGNFLCISCWSLLKFLPINKCCICNIYIKSTCFNCGLNIFGIFNYNETFSKLVMKFKYGNKFFLGKFFTNYLVNLYQTVNKDLDVKNTTIIYIPHYFGKQISISINSSLYLAYEFQKIFGGKIYKNILFKNNKKRQKNTKNFQERQNNAFFNYSINSNSKKKIYQKNCILIDDVITTGATVINCGYLISQYKPKNLYILCLGKVTF